MMVGIIDWDLFVNYKTFLPNVEVMLLSAYHKRKGDIVHLLLNPNNLQLYEKVYIRRNKKGALKFPDYLYSLPNVDLGGLYFTNGIVIPPKEEVFECTPDISIYDPYLKYCKFIDKKVGGLTKLETIPLVSLKKGLGSSRIARSVKFYDYDIGNENNLELLIKAHQDKLFDCANFANPIICNDLDTAIKFASQSFIAKLTKIYYPKIITWDDIYKISKEKLYLPIIGYFTEKNRIDNTKELDLIIEDALNKSMYCMVNSIRLELKTSPKVKITEENIILKYIGDWNCSTIQPAFYNFAKPKLVKKAMDEVLERNPHLKNLFFISPHNYRKQGGIWLK